MRAELAQEEKLIERAAEAPAQTQNRSADNLGAIAQEGKAEHFSSMVARVSTGGHVQHAQWQW